MRAPGPPSGHPRPVRLRGRAAQLRKGVRGGDRRAGTAAPGGGGGGEWKGQRPTAKRRRAATAVTTAQG